MSISRSIASYNLVIGRLHINRSPTFQTLLFPKLQNGGLGFLGNRTLQHLTTIHRPQNYLKPKRSFTVYSSVPPAAPFPSGPSPSSWRSWLLGMVVTIILPFVTHKWGPLLKWTKEFEEVVETMEEIVDAIEEVAEKVDEVAEDISDNLPEGGTLRRAIDFVEDLAEEIAKGANFAGDVIDKVQEVEDSVESIMEGDNEVAKEASHKLNKK